MNTVATAARSDVLAAEIEFLTPDVERPFTYAHETPPGAPEPTARFTPHAVQIQDARDGEPLEIDEHGVTLGRWPTRVRGFYDAGQIRRHYYPESAQIIRQSLGADRVVVFDHNVRRGTGLEVQPDRQDLGRPVHHAHTDYTPRSALARLRHELGAHAELSVSRYLQVNLWRPIRGPVRDAPLAFCDGSSVASDRLRTVELLYPDRVGEIYYLLHEPRQRWFFASDMVPAEAWLFKNFDSAPPGPGRVAPHSAFNDPRHRWVEPRESIEVRALAIFD